MKTLQMTWIRSIKIWWYWLWRTMFASLIVGLVVGIVLGIFVGPFIYSPDTLKLIGNVTGAVVGLYFGVFVMKSLPEKRFSDFRVVLVRSEPDEDSADA